MKNIMLAIIILISFAFSKKLTRDETIIQNSDNILNLYKHVNELAELSLEITNSCISFDDYVEYVIYCHSDSNVVGYRFYLEEDDVGVRYQEVYTQVGHPRFDHDNPIINHVEIRGNTVYMSNYIQPPAGTIREEEIKEPIEMPSFYGFFKWYLNEKVPIPELSE